METGTFVIGEDEITINLIDYNEVQEIEFPFFSSYKNAIDHTIKCFGFYANSELIAVSAIIPDTHDSNDGFVPLGIPIIYVFEVKKNLRNRGYGHKCVDLLLHNVIDSSTVQVCCTLSSLEFWKKVGFVVAYEDNAFMGKDFKWFTLLFSKKE